MIDRTSEKQYLSHFKEFGSGEESVYQTRALCQIADMLTAIAYDLHAIRETNTRKEGTE